MSRRRFGDADVTYKDFISAIDDHKRKRQREAAAQQQQAQQARELTNVALPPPATATSINYQGSSALGPAPLHPYASILNEETSARSVLGAGSPSLRAAEIGELPVGATESEASAFREFSLRHGPSSAFLPSTGSSRRLPLHLGSPYEQEPLLREEHKNSGGIPADAAAGEHVWLTKRNLDLVIQRKR